MAKLRFQGILETILDKQLKFGSSCQRCRAVPVKMYAYVNMLGRNDLKQTNSLSAGKELHLKPATMRREETTAETHFTAFVKGYTRQKLTS